MLYSIKLKSLYNRYIFILYLLVSDHTLCTVLPSECENILIQSFSCDTLNRAIFVFPSLHTARSLLSDYELPDDTSITIESRHLHIGGSFQPYYADNNNLQLVSNGLLIPYQAMLVPVFNAPEMPVQPFIATEPMSQAATNPAVTERLTSLEEVCRVLYEENQTFKLLQGQTQQDFLALEDELKRKEHVIRKGHKKLKNLKQQLSTSVTLQHTEIISSRRNTPSRYSESSTSDNGFETLSLAKGTLHSVDSDTCSNFIDPDQSVTINNAPPPQLPAPTSQPIDDNKEPDLKPKIDMEVQNLVFRLIDQVEQKLSGKQPPEPTKNISEKLSDHRKIADKDLPAAGHCNSTSSPKPSYKMALLKDAKKKPFQRIVSTDKKAAQITPTTKRLHPSFRTAFTGSKPIIQKTALAGAVKATPDLTQSNTTSISYSGNEVHIRSPQPQSKKNKNGRKDHLDCKNTTFDSFSSIALAKHIRDENTNANDNSLVVQSLYSQNNTHPTVSNNGEKKSFVSDPESLEKTIRDIAKAVKRNPQHSTSHKKKKKSRPPPQRDVSAITLLTETDEAISTSNIESLQRCLSNLLSFGDFSRQEITKGSLAVIVNSWIAKTIKNQLMIPSGHPLPNAAKMMVAWGGANGMLMLEEHINTKKLDRQSRVFLICDLFFGAILIYDSLTDPSLRIELLAALYSLGSYHNMILAAISWGTAAAWNRYSYQRKANKSKKHHPLRTHPKPATSLFVEDNTDYFNGFMMRFILCLCLSIIFGWSA